MAVSETTRIDPPHEMGYAATEAVSQVCCDAAPAQPSVAVPTDEPVWEQVRLQAEQLASHLRARQKELDHREAELNSRTARLEAEERATRLSREQREAEFASREKKLTDSLAEATKAQQEAEKRLSRLASTESSLQRRLHEAYLPDESAGKAQAGQEIPLSSQAAYAKEMAAARERMEAEHQQAMEEVERSRQAVQRRADYVERTQMALRQLRADLGRMHRETLEIRLATEELWAQLAGTAPSDAIAQSLGSIRTKLSDQYRQANAEIAEERRDLEFTRQQLIEQYEKLVEQKGQFEKWADACREECQHQAMQLAEREQQIQQEEALLRDRSRLVSMKNACLSS